MVGILSLFMVGCATQCPDMECSYEPCKGELIIIDLEDQEFEVHCSYYDMHTGDYETTKANISLTTNERLLYENGARTIVYPEYYVNFYDVAPSRHYGQHDERCSVYDGIEFTLTVGGKTVSDEYRFELEDCGYEKDCGLLNYITDNLI